MKKYINITLTALAFVGMMVFASQAAMAASQKDHSIDTGLNNSSVDKSGSPSTIDNETVDANSQAADDVNDVEDNQEAADAVSNEAEQAADIGDDINTPADDMTLPEDDYGKDN